jgi:hypothetical protein
LTDSAPRLRIDPWDPAYGVAVDVDELVPSKGDVDISIEVDEADWEPRAPAPGVLPAGRVLFVDGVRRIDAHVWLEYDGVAESGICASFAAGAAVCDGEARVVDAEIGRGVFTASRAAADITTSAGIYKTHVAPSAMPAQLSLALQDAMGKLEVAVAERASAANPSDLVVVDGPLRRRDHIRGAVGFVKTHHVAYLPPAQHRIVGLLGAGERTPLFTLGTGWNRFSWYLRLPGATTGAPWSGVVRCECSEDLSPAEARGVADVSARTLPRFASEPHKDPRAPQNLYPIGALENALRRRLGDRDLLYRSLRAAAYGASQLASG